MQIDSNSPPRAPPIKYSAPLGTRWAKEKAAAGGAAAFDLPTDPKNIGPWILGECIGKGASGRVKIARHRRTRQLAAVKILPITPLVNSRASLATQQAKSEKQRLGIDREITMMKLMNHPNIMRIYDVYEGEKELFLVLEYVEGGELFDFLVNRGRLPPAEALLYFRQIIYGLNYAHTFSIIHRDLKPENILIASLEPPIIKIADWGMAAFAPPSLQLETSCGSPHYASPEIVIGEKYFGTATDIWSCGVILFALLTGRLPFDDKNVRTLLSKVKSGKYDMPTWIDPLAKDLLTRMLVVDVRKRITIPDIIAHPWFSKIGPASYSQPSPAHTPVLPPSPSILARPIPSSDLIDPELFASLRVIWGRHAESQTASIQRDLCSPAGQGTYAKAFYFLLNRYREETLRSRSDDLDGQNMSIGSASELDSSSLSFTQDWDPQLPRGSRYPSSVNSSARAIVSTPATSRSPSVEVLDIAIKGDELNPLRANRPPPPAYTSGMVRALPTARLTVDGRKPSSVSASNVQVPSQRNSAAPGTSRIHQPRKSYRPQSPTRPDRRTMGGTMPIFSRPQRSASEHTGSRASALEGGYPAHLPFRSPSPIHPAKMASASAMDVDPKPSDAAEEYKDSSVISKAPHGTMGSGNEMEDSRPPSRDEAILSGRQRHTIALDKENVPTSDGWTHVDGRGVGLGRALTGSSVANRESLIPVAALKTKKEKERKSRPPPLELASYQRRTMLGSPIQQVVSPTTQGPPTSTRLMTSPVVGEFRGWFSNLFNWKTGSSQPSIFYSTEDGPQTRDLCFALFQSMGFIISRNLGEQATENCEIYHCRLDQLVSDPQTGLIMKPSRFRLEFFFTMPTAAPGTFPPPSPAPMALFPGNAQVHEHNGYFASSPLPSPNHLSVASTPTPTTGFSFRPRSSLLPGSGGGRPSAGSSQASTPTTATAFGAPTPGTWDGPPGCSCAITLVHEKGSTGTFKSVRERLREAFDSRGMALASCFSPLIPNTPFPEGTEKQQRVA